MKHKGTARLESERLILRPFTVQDADAMYRNWASDDEVTKYLAWPTFKEPETARKVLTAWTKSYKNKNFYEWAITLRDGPDEPIGAIHVVRKIDDARRTAEIDYCIGRAWWHQGIASEALMTVMDFLFDVVGIEKMVAKHDVRNPNSGRVMLKCGMKFDGTRKQSDWNNQGIYDASYYSLRREDRTPREEG